MSRPPTTTVFVGNLPFDTTEQQLQEILSTAGPIKHFKYVMDRETGRPKGFAFCEYFDIATAESARRNLNGRDLGGRPMRLDFAEDFQTRGRGGFGGGGGGGGGGGDGRPPMQQQQQQQQGAAIGMAAAALSAAQVRALLNGCAANDPEVQAQLDAAFAGMTRAQLYDVMREFKLLVAQDRAAALRYFAERPGLAKALFQGQVLLGMVKAPSVPQPAEPYGGAAAAAAGVAGAAPGGMMLQPGAVAPAPAAAAAGPYADGGQLGIGGGGQMGLQPQPPPPQPQQQPLVGPGGQPMQVVSLAPPPTAGAQVVSLAPPPPPPGAAQQQQQQQQPLAGLGGGGGDQTAALLRQVMAMSDAQIAALPPEHRAQVLYVKDQVARGAVRMP